MFVVSPLSPLFGGRTFAGRTMPTHTVLLVDEDLDSLTIYSLMLEHHGYRVLRAHGGEDAIRLTSDTLPDVVVTELRVAVSEGLSLAEHLKRDSRTAGVPILAVTSFPVRSGWHASGLAACDSYLAKPCAPSRLLAEVERCVSSLIQGNLPLS
jgi:DNA-binding response OmpR family regulator